MYGKSYFDFQYDFAKLLEIRFKTPILESIFLYTNIYLQLTHDFSFSKENAVWQNFIANFKDGPDYIYQKYLEFNTDKQDANDSKFGCFSYHYEPEDKTIKLHFTNRDYSGLGPLSTTRHQLRQTEIKDMFTDIKTNYPQADFVKGKSWLYNLEPYRSLFPPEFLAELREFTGPEWQFLTRWGQFISSEREVKQDLAQRFLACAESKDDVDLILDCFPLKILTAKIQISIFYDYFQNRKC